MLKTKYQRLQLTFLLSKKSSLLCFLTICYIYLFVLFIYYNQFYLLLDISILQSNRHYFEIKIMIHALSFAACFYFMISLSNLKRPTGFWSGPLSTKFYYYYFIFKCPLSVTYVNWMLPRVSLSQGFHGEGHILASRCKTSQLSTGQ